MEGEQQKGCRQLTFSIHPYDFRFHILRRLLPEDLFVLLVRRVDRKPPSPVLYGTATEKCW